MPMKKTLLILTVIVLALIVGIIAFGPEYKLRLQARRCTFNDNLVGSIYSGNCMLPSGPMSKTFTFLGTSYSNMGGSAISDVYVEPSYGIQRFQKQNTDEYLLFYDKIIGRDGSHAIFLVLDILKTPVIKKSEKLMYGKNVCKFNGNFDNEILAIAKDEEVHELANIVKAWRANTANGKFEEISVTGILCEQECVGNECI
jgi:hypothetical protein